MKTLFFKSFVLLFFTLTIISCNNNSKKVVENNIQFDSLTVDKIYHMMDIETNPSCSLQIKFIYPVNLSDKKILSLLQQQFIACYFGEDYTNLPPEDAANRYLEYYINDFKAQEKDFLADQHNHQEEPNESWYSSNETSYNQIVYNQNNVLSLVINKEYYKGGAHNAHSYLNYVFNLETGKRITESEIFIDDYQDNLATIIVREIAILNNINDVDDLENIGFFNINEIYPNKNFYVDDKGLNYTFNEYEIAAYVVGPILVHLPYEKIQHLLRKDSPIANIAF
ncbi:MAG: DUF3298 and DUF4163 domain-containing protein [Tannerella sp.]|jgi:hypothetical protein|nr:DUF3298 and DUF4163 domain-containing protein [Tannerella sp.]